MAFVPPHELSGLPQGTPMLLALSGGPDSRALLYRLLIYCRQTDTPLAVAHVNHMIRGAEADRDERFARALAAEVGINCYVERVDIPRLAAERGQGLEETARRERYRFFDRIMVEQNIPILVTAHNADDRLETLLFNLARGSGLRGLCSLRGSRRTAHGVLIRPLIYASKAEIEAYLSIRDLDFVTDSTNSSDDYSRNRIRHTVVPALAAVNPALIKNAGRLADSLAEDADFIEGQATRYLEEGGEDACRVSRLRELHPALLPRVLDTLYMRAMAGQGGREQHITPAAPDAVSATSATPAAPGAPNVTSEPGAAHSACHLETVHIDMLRELVMTGHNGMSLALPGLRAALRGGYLSFIGNLQ